MKPTPMSPDYEKAVRQYQAMDNLGRAGVRLRMEHVFCLIEAVRSELNGEPLPLWQGSSDQATGVQQMYGFRQVNMTDHEFAKWLRARGALGNVTSQGNSNQWRDSSGKVVAVAFYDNAKPDRTIWLAEAD